MFNKKVTLKEVKKNLTSSNAICPIRFDRLSWLKTYPDSDNAAWEAAMVPYNAISFLYDNIVEAMELDEEQALNTKFKIVTITKDYFDWLNEHNLPNTPESRSDYAVNLSVKKANDLAREAGMDVFTDVYLIPYVYESIDGPLEKLEEPDRIALVNKLKDAYEFDVYLPGAVFDASVLGDTNLGDLYSDMIDTNLTDFPDPEKAIPSVKINNLGIYVGFIPFTAIYHMPSMELSLFEYLQLVDDDYFNISASTWNLYEKEPTTIIKDDVGLLAILPYAIDFEDVPREYDEIMKNQVDLIKNELVQTQIDYEAKRGV